MVSWIFIASLALIMTMLCIATPPARDSAADQKELAAAKGEKRKLHQVQEHMHGGAEEKIAKLEKELAAAKEEIGSLKKELFAAKEEIGKLKGDLYTMTDEYKQVAGEYFDFYDLRDHNGYIREEDIPFHDHVEEMMTKLEAEEKARSAEATSSGADN